MTRSALTTAVLRGATAGAAGTTALNAATYLDMATRGSTAQPDVAPGRGPS